MDSAANPTNVITPSTTMHPLHHPLLTQTAANNFNAYTHSGPTVISTDKHQITLPTVANPSLNANVVSVHDLATIADWLFLRAPTGTYSTTIIPTFPACLPLPLGKNGRYHLSNAVKPQAYWIRTQYTPPCRTKAKTKTLPPPLTPSKQAVITPHSRPPDSRLLSQPHPKPSNHTPISADHAMNHINPRTVRGMAKRHLLPVMPHHLSRTPPSISCSACPPARHKPKPHYPKQHQYAVGEFLSTDTCDPIKPTSKHGNIHFLTFIDTM